MADLVGGALLGTAFSILYEGLRDLIRKNLNFGSILEDIKSSLASLNPVIQHIIVYFSKEELEEIQGLVEVIHNGKVLVGKCLVQGSNPLKKSKYAKQLVEWNNSLRWQVVILNIWGIIDQKKTAVSVLNIEAKVQEVLDHLKSLDSGNRNKFAEIEAWCAVPDPPHFTVGLDEPLKELKRKMFKDGVSKLVVSALGGSGKTTLAIHFCRDPQVKDKFKKNIFFVTVSKNFNLELIVQQLYKRKGCEVPAFTNQENAVTWLQTFLKDVGREPLLLVLDDVWPGSESLLDKFRCESESKILFTSRSEIPRLGFQYKLKLLNDVNARELFYHSASLGIERPRILELSTKVIECCKGLPIAIKVVGGSFLDQPIETWRDRVIELSEGHSIIASETELLDCLQKSSDALDEKTKKYFLDLSAFPEDNRISVGALIDMWAGLYDLTPDIAGCVGGLTHEDEHTVCMAKLNTLKSRNLVTLVDTRKGKIDEDGYYNGHYVTQHDLLRELAIHLSGLDPVEQRKRLIIDIRGNNIPKWWRKQKHHLMKARLLSVSTGSVFSTTMPNMPLPQAKVLILNFQTKKYVLPEFVENMQNLKVLLVRYDGSSHAKLDHFELLSSLRNLKRVRLESVSICSITKNPIKLESLRKMSLFMCDLSQAFSNGHVKISDAFPKLEEMNIDNCYYSKEFLAECCDLVHLIKLSITECHDLVSLPEGIGSLVKLEVLRLRSCTALSMIPESVRKLIHLKFLDISDCSSIYKLPEFMGEMSSLRKLDMRYCPYMELPESVLDLKKLEEVICSYKAKKLWEAIEPSLGSIRIVAMLDLKWSDFYS